MISDFNLANRAMVSETQRTAIIAVSDCLLQGFRSARRSFRHTVGKHYPNRIAIVDTED